MHIALDIDDFGTGCSSLSHLPLSRCKSLKIDRSFVTRMIDDAHSLEIVRAIIGLGHNLGINVIAEGIENQDQLDLLRSYGCGFGQGFYLGRPLSADDSQHLIQNAANSLAHTNKRPVDLGDLAYAGHRHVHSQFRTQ